MQTPHYDDFIAAQEEGETPADETYSDFLDRWLEFHDEPDSMHIPERLWATEDELRIERNREVLLDEWGHPLEGHPDYEAYMEDLYRQQESEIYAENAWLRHAENQYDPDDEYERMREANDPFLSYLREGRGDE